MSEKRFEDALKDMIKEYWPDAHVRKLASPFSGGILDLYIKRPGRMSMWLELKFEKRASTIEQALKKSPLYPIKLDCKNKGLSDLQRNFIRKEQRAGGTSGWMIMVEFANQETVIYSSHDADCKQIPISVLIANGCKGKKHRRTKDQLIELFGRIEHGKAYS